jgi:hypothetical protein
VSEFIDVHVIGAKEAAAKLNLVGARAADMRPAFIAVRELLLEGHKRQFESKGQYLGTPWAPLSDATLERKSREGQSTEILNATGALQNALEGGSGKVGTVGKTFARAGVSGKLFEARFAQAGASGENRRGSEPARTIVGIGIAEGEEAVNILEAFLVGAA